MRCMVYCRVGDEVTYHRVADETLDELTEFLEDLGERGITHRDFDTSLAVRQHNPNVWLETLYTAIKPLGTPRSN